MQVVVAVGIVIAVLWFLATAFALTLAHTAKHADLAGRRLVIPPRGVTPAPHPVAR